MRFDEVKIIGIEFDWGVENLFKTELINPLGKNETKIELEKQQKHNSTNVHM